jgi:hypothetical protein
MDARLEFLKQLREQELARGHFLGLLHLLIGRRVELPDGTPVGSGITWRDLAALLKKVRWPREAALELHFDPETLPQRDRERYWYTVIAHAGVASSEAIQQGDALAEILREAGFKIGPAPGGPRTPPTQGAAS